MDKIISLDKKLKRSAAQKAAVIRKQKIQAVRKIFVCTHCANKCERCGTSVGIEPRQESDQALIPYHFCSSCAEEYRAYINKLQGHGEPDTYWYNEEWLHLWRQWIDYQGAVDQYKRSKEFQRLLNELRQGEDSCPD
jgi:hypothetical protein